MAAGAGDGYLGGGSRGLAQRTRRRRHREALAALRAVPLWGNLPEGWLLEVARTMSVHLVPAGTVVVRQGEPGDRFYIVVKGSFEVVVDGRSEKRLGPGQYFGEMALLRDTPRTATVQALESSQVFSVGRTMFQAALAHDLATHARLEASLAYRAQVAGLPLFGDLAPTELDLLLTRLHPVHVEAARRSSARGTPVIGSTSCWPVRLKSCKMGASWQVGDRARPSAKSRCSTTCHAPPPSEPRRRPICWRCPLRTSTTYWPATPAGQASWNG